LHTLIDDCWDKPLLWWISQLY